VFSADSKLDIRVNRTPLLCTDPDKAAYSIPVQNSKRIILEDAVCNILAKEFPLCIIT